MSEIVVKVENLSKAYRLGVINHGMLYKDIQSWWARVRGKEDPNSIIFSNDQLSLLDANGRFWALRNIDFYVNKGEVLGIIGRNGAGKSTLLKILSKVTSPTSGIIKINGRVSSLLEVGTGFHPELTGRENVFLNGSIMGMSKSEIRQKFDEIVEFAEIDKFIDTPVKRYSSGMYVRLAFSVAAHLEPEIMLVDEVLAVGDASFQRKCLGKMESVGREGRTVMFVSHNMGSIKSLCKKGMFLNKGRIEYVGDVNDVIDHYLSSLYKTDAFVEYDVDKSKIIQIKSVKLLDYKNQISSSLDMLKPFRIEIEYQVNEDVTGVVIAVNLFTSYGECLLATADHDLDRTKLGKRSKGISYTYVDIPGELLNSGIYALVVGISMPGKIVYDRKEVMSFELYDSGSFIVNGGGEDRRNSLLLLGLPWDA